MEWSGADLLAISAFAILAVLPYVLMYIQAHHGRRMAIRPAFVRRWLAWLYGTWMLVLGISLFVIGPDSGWAKGIVITTGVPMLVALPTLSALSELMSDDQAKPDGRQLRRALRQAAFFVLVLVALGGAFGIAIWWAWQ